MFQLITEIEKNITAFPDKKIIIDSESAFTYREFGDFAKRIAAKLNRGGVGKGDFVTIELPRAKEYIAAMYGALLAGAGYAALSPDYPEDRLEYIRENSNAKAIINERFLRGIENEAPLDNVSERDADSPALLIYTSGSTGKPKGVLHNYDSVSDSVYRYGDIINLEQGSTVALGAPFTFIVSLIDILYPLTANMAEYIIPYKTMRDPVLLADFVADNQINHLFISPKMLKIFKQKGTSLKSVYTGSERVSDIYFDDFDVIVFYGQSECAGTLSFVIDKKYDNTPIGKPAKGVCAYVLDEQGNEAEEGELCLSGLFASCYIGLEEQTRNTFVPNPFAERDGNKHMLKTGDIVKRGEDGNIIFLNRKDWMVKINGQRVEPAEIETIIKATDGVFDAVIKDFKNQYNQVYLVAYYVESEPINADDIKKEIAKKLPSYMVPAFFVKLDKLPVNQNGKLDRSALKAPEASDFRNEYIAPETDMQRAICAAFEKVLKMENISVDDDFFALGGDSIKSAMVCSECTLYRLSSADIFAGKTPRAIERILLEKAAKTPALKRGERMRIYPLTPMERGMYLEQKLDENSTVYNLNLAFTIKGADVDTVKKAINKVFMVHEALHSTYGEENGLPVRILTKDLPEIAVVDGKTYDEVMEIVDTTLVPFNLNEGVPARSTLYTLSDGRIVYYLQIHHIAFDGGSAQPFFNEFVAALKNEDVAAPDIDLSDLYEDALNADNSKGMDFYKELFSDGVPVNDMPLRGKRPKVHPLGNKEIKFTFDEDKIKTIDIAAKKCKLTEFELVFSAIAMTLGKYTASEDVVLGIPTNMRPAGADNVVGMFVNTAPVRIKPVRNATLSDYLAQTSEAVRNATYGASLPFEDIVGEFVKTRDESRNPIFDVSVNYHTIPDTYSKDGLCVSFYNSLQKMSRDIGIVIVKNDGKLNFTVQYSTELFEDVVVENFTQQFTSVLDALADGTANTVREAMELPESQRKVLEGFSVEGECEIPVTLLHKAFEKSAKEHENETALIAKDGAFTYRQLNEMANKVAHNLIDKGVGVGDSVLLLLPRRSCFFASMFGVNKAGAAFIPCDPQYPADRINHIITDSEASFIITTDDKMADYPAEKAINIDDLLAGDNTENPDVHMSDEELSYMIYTSGSTGKPKGVMLRHKGICSYLYPHPANIHIHRINECVNNYLSVTTVSFDMSFKEHCAALLLGKTLVFAAEDEMNDPRALAELMAKHSVDCINATPSRLNQYMEYEPFTESLKNCTLIMSGGEAYPMSLRDNLKVAAPNAMIVNTYGPTEITVSCNAGDLTNADYVTVGRPLLNYREYIVDKFGDIAPYGVIGELYIGGIGVAKGYKNLPEKTAQAFVTYGGETMYRSGDYSKWDKNGYVQILGRLDNQVKLRGLRIELGEIEGLIAAQEHIKNVVVVIKKINNQENLCAYFTADEEIDINALRDELKKHLTHYMVPTAYLQMNEMPVTANGKTDVKNLPEPVSTTISEYVAPANDIEKFFCEVFEKALKLDKVGATDDFFELGGSSLVVTSVVVAASEKGYELTYGDVFKMTTPRKLAELFADGTSSSSAQLFDFEDYDYSKIDALLKNNTVESYLNGEMRELGNIMITGATGYMGAHLLAQFLTEEKGKAYCLIRKGIFKTAKSRLQSMMFYYFDQKFVEEVENRVEVIDGDVTDYACFEQFEKLPIDTIFNCAANVKHFSSGTDIEDINVGGAVNCVKLAEKLGARLVHFSTISVGGTTDDLDKLSQPALDEQSFYFGQDLDNKYISSKLMGERMVLEAVADNRIDGKVIRVGTLSARESDGEFQINFLTNNFMGRLRSYNLLGCFPYNMIENQACMGPIDTSCEAFLKLSKTPKACCVFNAVNNHTIPLGDIIRQMNKNGMNIRFVEYKDFVEALTEAQKDADKAAILSSMTAYMGHSSEKPIITVPFSSHYTTQILARLSFFWNSSNEQYVNHFINALRGFVFFDTENLNR
ncbi:MAG: amino acid adenylation domain-containing protein [Eubacterium sp.]|nr:amino acid adenylation domain-containing protein [Eubacterium sp.]